MLRPDVGHAAGRVAGARFPVTPGRDLPGCRRFATAHGAGNRVEVPTAAGPPFPRRGAAVTVA